MYIKDDEAMLRLEKDSLGRGGGRMQDGMMGGGGVNCQITPGDLTAHTEELGGALRFEKLLSPQKAESAYSDGRMQQQPWQGQGSSANSREIPQALHCLSPDSSYSLPALL